MMQEKKGRRSEDTWEYGKCYLQFSCRGVELNAREGERIEGSFTIHSDNGAADGNIYSTDTRMQCDTPHFTLSETEDATITYTYYAPGQEAGTQVRGEFVIISSEGEYSLPYRVNVGQTELTSSLGAIRNLFHFANLAKANWAEAVRLFYSTDFISIFRKNDKNLETIYLGLSRMEGNEENVEEFLIETNKKAPITYQTDMEGFVLEDVLDTETRVVAITRSGWGYLHLNVRVQGDFISVDKTELTAADFEDDLCRLAITIDATKLRHGINTGCVTLGDTCTTIELPVRVTMPSEENVLAGRAHERTRAEISLVNSYIDMRFRKITRHTWAERSAQEIARLQELYPNDIHVELYQVQLLITRERFNEAKWYLDRLEQSVFDAQTDTTVKCYYLYLETLYNRDESYLQAVTDEVENEYAKDETNWRLAWFLMYLQEDYTRNPEAKWHFLQEQFKRGCTSPLLFCEAVVLLQNHPSFVLQLGAFEQNVMWFAAKHQMLDADMVEQLQYQCARIKEYSPLLFQTLCEVYRTRKTPQTIAVICRLLILGERRGRQYFTWYAQGVAAQVRVTRLYEYYMMSVDITDRTLEIPKLVLMYFAYQSNLDYEHNAYLYAYIVRHREQYPELERNYRIAMERFVPDQIRLGHINEDLAYLYEYLLAPQMLRDDAANALAPLLFMHKITVENPQITSVVIVHEKINGESSYPVSDHTCMIPIYGDEYCLFLQDAQGNRYTKRIPYRNERMMNTERLLPYVEPMIEGRLSFDIYLCEQDRNYITITADNVARFRHLAESEQVADTFRKEIRTRLLQFYYDNDRIGELDTFLEETEAEALETQERAQFIQFLISRGMFDKAYLWIRQYGASGVNRKSLARLVSRRIVSSHAMREDFLVNVSYYIYKNMKYDEPILQYLMQYYEGRTQNLRNIWRSASELQLDTTQIAERLLRQMRYTHTAVPEKDKLLEDYAVMPAHDETLVQELLEETAYAYFVRGVVTDAELFDLLYLRYRKSGEASLVYKLALLRFWAEHPDKRRQVVRDTLAEFAGEMVRRGIYFPFYRELAASVPLLHYYQEAYFVEYRTEPHRKVLLHYVYDTEENATMGDYLIEELKEMYDGIYVKSFMLFCGEFVQYYITETIDGAEQVTQSGTLAGTAEVSGDGRFGRLNDIFAARAMHDESTALQLAQEYMQEDYSARELFRVI